MGRIATYSGVLKCLLFAITYTLVKALGYSLLDGIVGATHRHEQQRYLNIQCPENST
jgi:hypothetical protein